MNQTRWRQSILIVGGVITLLMAYGSGMRGQKKALETVKQERRVLREDLRNTQLVTRGREGLLHQFEALSLLDAAVAEAVISPDVVIQVLQHLKTSDKIEAASDADVKDIIARLGTSQSLDSIKKIANTLRRRLSEMHISPDLETPVTVAAPSLNDVPKQPGPEIGR